jgi:type IV pilus assembly protein PilB
MTYRKLGEMLVQGGLITSLQLSIALAAQQTSNRRLGEIVVERGFCTEDQIALCLAEQFGYEVADMATHPIQPEAIVLLKAEFALEQGVLAVEVNGEDATFVIFDPVNVEATDQVAVLTKKRAKFLISARTSLIAMKVKLLRLQMQWFRAATTVHGSSRKSRACMFSRPRITSLIER